MIKIIYEGKAYDYEFAGRQAYDIKSEIDLKEEITSPEAMAAFIRILDIAGFPVTGDERLKQLLQDTYEEVSNE